MDENADLRLTIETARKNKNWARRCYAYELAMEYFSLLEPDCYELCSYCDLIPEFLEEKNECCLMRALGSVKVFINRCVDAPSIARAVTRVIIDRIFFSASTKVREIATDIILDFIEWEACNAVLKELITGALKYDGVRSDECIKVMRYALLDFGPHVISVYKLIDFIADLVRKKSFLSIDEECSQLLIVIYKCLGPLVRVYLTQILDPDYISAIEDSYDEMRNIPIYHCRFVRYSKDNSPSLEDSDEEMFAACRIVEPTSHPSSVLTDYGNEEMAAEGEGMVLDADQSNFRDFGREPNYRAADAGPYGNENKGYWDPQRLDNMANYQMDNGANPLQRNQVRLNAYDNVLAYDVFEHSNRADSIPELGHIPEVYPEPEQQVYQWNPNNFERLNERPRSISTVDMACQAGGCSQLSTNPFEVIIQKMMDKYGAEDTLYWLCLKLNSKSETPLSDTGTKESRRINLSRNCKSLEALTTSEEQTQNEARSSISNTSRKLFSITASASSFAYNSNEISFDQKSVKNVNEEENSIRYGAFPLVEKNATRSLQVLEKKDENMVAEAVIPFKSVILSQKYLQTNTLEEKKENLPGLVKNKFEIRTAKRNLFHRFLRKILFFSSKKKKSTDNITKDRKSFNKKFQFVFKEKRKYINKDDPFYPYLVGNQQANYFHQDASINLPPKTENDDSYFDKHIQNSRHSYSTNRSRFTSQRTVFSGGWQTHQDQNQIPAGFHPNPEELQKNACRSVDFQSPSKEVKENEDEEIVVLSESESISEISPSLCCYCFQKNSIRRLSSKNREANSQGDGKTEQDNDGENISGCLGSGFERRNENAPFSLTNEMNVLGAMSLRHRGSGDVLSHPALNREAAPEEPVPEEESQSAQRSQKLCCCISMNDKNEEAFQFGT